MAKRNGAIRKRRRHAHRFDQTTHGTVLGAAHGLLMAAAEFAPGRMQRELARSQATSLGHILGCAVRDGDATDTATQVGRLTALEAMAARHPGPLARFVDLMRSLSEPITEPGMPEPNRAAAYAARSHAHPHGDR